MEKKTRNKIVAIASNVVGATIGTAISVLNPDLAVTGAVIAPIISGVLDWVINEASDNVYSVREKKNIAQTLVFANDSVNPSAEEIDEEWFARYIDIAKAVSDEEVQYVWGKILAQEINEKSSFSLRTLETIKNISHDEALMFERMLPFIFYKNGIEPVIPQCESINEFGVGYECFMCMMDAGLISSSAAIIFKVSSAKDCVFKCKEHIIVIKGIKSITTNMPINVYPLSKAGTELIKIIQWKENLNFIYKYCDELKRSHSSNAVFSVKEIVSFDGKSITYR